jgi:hypothetical protein
VARDLRVAEPAGGEREHVELARRQPVRRRDRHQLDHRGGLAAGRAREPLHAH